MEKKGEESQRGALMKAVHLSPEVGACAEVLSFQSKSTRATQCRPLNCSRGAARGQVLEKQRGSRFPKDRLRPCLVPKIFLDSLSH